MFGAACCSWCFLVCCSKGEGWWYRSGVPSPIPTAAGVKATKAEGADLHTLVQMTRWLHTAAPTTHGVLFPNPNLNPNPKPDQTVRQEDRAGDQIGKEGPFVCTDSAVGMQFWLVQTVSHLTPVVPCKTVMLNHPNGYSTPSTLCSTPRTLCSTPATLCSTPSTLRSTPSTLCSTPSTLCGTLCTLCSKKAKQAKHSWNCVYPSIV